MNFIIYEGFIRYFGSSDWRFSLKLVNQICNAIRMLKEYSKQIVIIWFVQTQVTNIYDITWFEAAYEAVDEKG